MRVRLLGEGVGERDVVGEDGEGGGLQQGMKVSSIQADYEKFPVEGGIPGLVGDSLLLKKAKVEGLP